MIIVACRCCGEWSPVSVAAPGNAPPIPIIDPPLWNAVHAQLGSNIADRNSGTRARQQSLLAGILFDGDGNRTTPTHAIKNCVRYRYYVSRPLITKVEPEPSRLRIPARELEQAVTGRVCQWLLGPGTMSRRLLS